MGLPSQFGRLRIRPSDAPRHDIIDATFEFANGKIICHADTFDLWRWAGMALGPKGKLLGWLPPIKNAIHKTAMKGLDAFKTKRA